MVRFALTNRGDVVFADDDGCLFAVAERLDELLRVAHEIWQREGHQAEVIKSGHSLREQLEFARYLKSGVMERINLQREGSKAKPYQVKQVRKILAKYKLL